MSRRVRHYTIYTGGKERIPGLPFQGELMTCCICGAQRRSNPGEESNWTCFTTAQISGKRVYLCPSCWSQENLEKALRILAAGF